jgi:hypothetical protein
MFQWFTTFANCLRNVSKQTEPQNSEMSLQINLLRIVEASRNTLDRQGEQSSFL